MELIDLVLMSNGNVLNELETETLIEIFRKLDYSNNEHKKYILQILKILFKRKHIDYLNNNYNIKNINTD